MKKTREILGLEKTLLNFDKLCASIDFIQVKIASPERIKSWATRILNNKEIRGKIELTKTFNFKALLTEFGGLFCQRIFGPIKDKVCACLNNRGNFINKVCTDCEVELIESRVRRYKMGYIELISPVSHIWYFQGKPSYLADVLRCFDQKIEFEIFKSKFIKEDYLSFDNLKKLIYSDKPSSILNKTNHPLHQIYTHLNLLGEKIPTIDIIFKQSIKNSFFDFKNNIDILDKEIKRFTEPSGVEIIKAALENLNLDCEIIKARNIATTKIAANKISIETIDLEGASLLLSENKQIFRRIRILESFKSTKTSIDSMILTILPVLPPGLRPIYQLENGQMIMSDINEIYCRIINTINDAAYAINNTKFRSLSSFYTFRKQLQELIDSLIDNSRAFKKMELNNTPLISFTEMLEGKSGRFRHNILGKRVDYSGRTVITAEPSLRINECGLPIAMALELFKPFLINKILGSIIYNEKIANYILNKKKPYIWVLIKQLMRKHCIMLNRAPTLHKHGIQAFNPFLVLDNAIHLHPLVCTGFNADFDGDQMAVHLPIHSASQIESSFLMKPSSNLILQSNGELILKPTQDIVIGNFYLTLMFKRNNFISLNPFATEKEALYAYFKKVINLHSRILIRYSISNILLKICFRNLKILDNTDELAGTQLIKIYKIFKSKTNYYIITNLGILIARKKKNYII